MEHDVNMKVTCIAIRSAQEAGKVFFKALMRFSLAMDHTVKDSKNTSALKKSMVKIKDLRADGSKTEVIDTNREGLKDFRRYARAHGVAYAVEKDNSTFPPQYYIFFKAKDDSHIRKAISDYVTDKEKTKNMKDSLNDRLMTARAKVKKTSKIRRMNQIR